jgi:hypothetical protein
VADGSDVKLVVYIAFNGSSEFQSGTCSQLKGCFWALYKACFLY